ncbi:carbamate kinase [Salmonella sp. NCTC 11881]|uniref:Carbamate kinase n=1 Tax=Salmonella enterica I TaxID=59201 RepID=A0A447MWM5_SALET|nr:carbamate kinase [Salmonella enterica subsp. enterica]VUC88856.1 carbamate kinase [Salmonella sp. NCTC 11881]
MKTLVVALGGNALLQRGEALTAENQYRNIADAVPALARLARSYRLAIVHGNGPPGRPVGFTEPCLESR